MHPLSPAALPPCALIYTFLLEVDNAEAFVVRSGGGRSSPHASATSSADAGASASSSVDPEEAMRKAFARLSILTAEDVQLFSDGEDEQGGNDEMALMRSFFRKLEVKYELPALDKNEEVMIEETPDDECEDENADEQDPDATRLWLPSGHAPMSQSMRTEENDDTKYDMSQAIKDYEETCSTLQRETAMDSKSSPIIDAYVRNGDLSNADVGMSKQNDNMERDDASTLIPEPNPQADPDAVSLAGVSNRQVLSGLMSLFPPKDLSFRNAASRKDGYWEFISKGEEPPKQFTYGEFDFHFFSQLLDRARYYYTYNGDTEGRTAVNSWDGMTFTDIGAGAGRLVFAAAALHPGFRLCRGLEILPSIHQVAEANLEKCRVSKRNALSLFPEENLSNVVDGPTKLWQIPKETDEDWLQNFSGALLGDKIEEDEEEDEWFNPDDWASNYGSSDDKTNDDDEDWENPDQFLQSICDESQPGNEDDVAAADTSDDDYFLSCPPTSEDGSIMLEEDLQKPKLLPLAPIEFNCGSFEDEYEYFGDSDVIFVFSSCMSQDLMSSLSMAIGRQCKPGSVVITTEFSLPLEGHIGPYQCSIDDVTPSSFASQGDGLPTGSYKLELLESVDGWVWLTGGESTAYIHRVVESLWEEGVGKRDRPAPTVRQEARAVVEAIRCDSLANTEDFLREVRNNILFNGLPDEWRVEQNTRDENGEHNTTGSESEVLLL